MHGLRMKFMRNIIANCWLRDRDTGWMRLMWCAGGGRAKENEQRRGKGDRKARV